MAENAQTFNFELVSPEEKLLSEAAVMAVIPGEEGTMGVLPNHSALVSSLKAGVVEVFASEGSTPKRIFIAGGFADISPDNCTILAEEAISVSDLDEAALRQRIDNLNDDLKMLEGAADKARAQKALLIAKAKLEAVAGPLAA